MSSNSANNTLWLAYTLQPSAVQHAACRTQTHKGTLAVLTLSINAGIRLALVHICGRQKQTALIDQLLSTSITACVPHAVLWTERTNHWPPQTSDSGSKMYPLGHWQVKLPGVFLHRPFSHSSRFSTHSSMSGGKQTQRQVPPQWLFICRLCFFWEEIAESTYQRSFSQTGRPQSLRCRCICMTLSYSHTRHSGRCQGRAHTRWYLGR